MEIKSVEYQKPDPTAEDGQTFMWENFFVIYKDGNEVTVPMVKTNRHYQEVAAWYKKQKKKPFEYNFED